MDIRSFFGATSTSTFKPASSSDDSDEEHSGPGPSKKQCSNLNLHWHRWESIWRSEKNNFLGWSMMRTVKLYARYARRFEVENPSVENCGDGIWWGKHILWKEIAIQEDGISCTVWTLLLPFSTAGMCTSNKFNTGEKQVYITLTTL